MFNFDWCTKCMIFYAIFWANFNSKPLQSIKEQLEQFFYFRKKLDATLHMYFKHNIGSTQNGKNGVRLLMFYSLCARSRWWWEIVVRFQVFRFCWKSCDLSTQSQNLISIVWQLGKYCLTKFQDNKRQCAHDMYMVIEFKVKKSVALVLLHPLTNICCWIKRAT
jgi:hypothetical protein